ncbi:MAG TPA: VanZ family protein [Syntrophales bacterium]|jgi:VanZ family protein|nr:VanZ family protein [Syntrophales bacterium]
MSLSLDAEGKYSPFIYALWGFSIVAVTVLSLYPHAEVPIGVRGIDKVGHFFAYLWLALLPALVMKSPRRSVLLFAGLVSLGVLLEVGQMYVPGRMFSFADMGADAAGVISGIFMGKRYRVGLWKRLPAK